MGGFYHPQGRRYNQDYVSKHQRITNVQQTFKNNILRGVMEDYDVDIMTMTEINVH